MQTTPSVDGDGVALTSPTIPDGVSPPGAKLRRAIDAGDPTGICRESERLLELIADRLGWTVGMSVVRRRGDGSLADRWPGVAHALRKTDADDAAEQVTRSPLFRGLAAPRGDEQAGTASAAEARRFGKAALSVLDRTNCAGCGEWWRASAPGASRWTCRCRSLVVVSRSNTR
jgi:hypothetical protein